MSDVGTSASDFDSTGNSLNEAEELEMRERRDSGVGASLTRPCRYRGCGVRPGLRDAGATRGCSLAATLRCCSRRAALSVTERSASADRGSHGRQRSLWLCWRSLALSLRNLRHG